MKNKRMMIWQWFVLVGMCAGTLLTTPIVAIAQDVDHDDKMAWWREARFGMFIHWGLYSIPAGEWNGETHHAEWILTTAQIPVAEYETLADQFNPVNFDADAWVDMAKDAGMKYIVITSKHHDGFALFDSKVSDFDIMATPFRRDIMHELSEAAREQGIKMCWYHSIMDWHHPDYLPRRAWEKRSAEGADFDRFEKYLYGQVEELLTNYGDIGVMWFDGEWEETWTHERGKRLYDFVQTLQPNIIINNRVDKGRQGMQGMTSDDKFRGDFGTPEQEIPPTGKPGVDWETCMTMNDRWGYNAFDHNFKSTADLIHKLIDIVSKGGNFLLNVGPKPDGTFPNQSIDRLQEIGEWMDVYGESIYGTDASPFEFGAETQASRLIGNKLGHGFTGNPEFNPVGVYPSRCTIKHHEDGSSTLYFHIFNEWRPINPLIVPGIANEPGAATLLGSDATLTVERHESDWHIQLPDERPSEIANVVKVEVAEAFQIHNPPRIIAESDIFLDELSVQLVSDEADAVTLRYTLDGSLPTASSDVYEGPFMIRDSATVTVRAFRDGKPLSSSTIATFAKVQPRPALQMAMPAKQGIICETYQGQWVTLPDFDTLENPGITTLSILQIPGTESNENQARRLRSLLLVPKDGIYTFALNSDDGSRLLIGSEDHQFLVVDNDGLHEPLEKTGCVALAKGLHHITVEWFNRNGPGILDVKWGENADELQTITEDQLLLPDIE